MSILLLIALLGLAPGTLGSSPGPGVERAERTVHAMGTVLGVAVDAPDRAGALALTERVVEEVARWEALLSTWDTTTPVSRLNRRAAGVPMGPGEGLPDEVVSVLAAALRWQERTAGAFNPAVGPLVDAWGLRSGGRTPGAEELRRARAASATGAFRASPDGIAVTRVRPGAWLDTGGFGKGAALEAAARLLRAADVASAVVDLGGQVRVVGSGASGLPAWPVDVAHPTDRGRVAARLLLRDASAATSGTGERGRHLLDPRTGRPAPARGSVTVVAADAFVADVLATALYVMGPDDGLAFVESLPDVGALFLIDDGAGGLAVRHDSSMTRWLTDAPGLHDFE